MRAGLALFPVSPEPSQVVEEMLAARGDLRDLRGMRPCASGGRSSARHSPIRSAGARLLAATNGIWMRSLPISIAGEPHWLWRAVDQGTASFLDVPAWSNVEEDTRAAQRLMKEGF